MNAEPGQQEAGTDEGLEEESQVGEPMLPTGIVGPGRMLRRRGGRSRGGRGLGRLPWGHLPWHLQRGALQAPQDIAPHDAVATPLDAARTASTGIALTRV